MHWLEIYTVDRVIHLLNSWVKVIIAELSSIRRSPHGFRKWKPVDARKFNLVII